MNETMKNRVIILAITEGNMTVNEAAKHFQVSKSWIYKLLKRYKTGGLQAVDPQPKTPKTNPNKTNPQTIKTILALRKTLTKEGLDAGAQSIYDRLPEENRPSPATIWRILKKHEMITPQPQKRPRTSWHRFEASAPNEMWQSDFTHYRLADGTDTEIISWLDDHSRYLLHASAHPRITGPTVIETFTQTMDTYGPPAATLTDNGMVYTTRLAGGYHGNTQPNAFEQLLADLNINQRNGRPSKPTTQGKIERYHQTLKQWLNAQKPPQTIEELNQHLTRFTKIYNTERPHRAISRKTPHQAYNATPKAGPTIEINKQYWRIRYDRVDQEGKTTLRYAGKLRHLGIGKAYRHQRVIILIHGPNTQVINRHTGEIIAEHTIDPNRDYQPKHQNSGR